MSQGLTPNLVHEQATRILAIRHGETAWNLDGRMQGHRDIPLNATGRWQAQRLADALSGENIAAVYASDLLRAHETARAVAAGRSLTIGIERALRERCFGKFEGMTFKEIDQRWPVEAESWRVRDPDFAPQGGESLRVFYARCIQVIARLASAHAGETITLVAHGGVMDCFYRAAARVDLQAPRSWQLGNASINRLLYTEGGLSLVGWSDTFHLENPALEERST
ncbi:MAG: histidine phosphatase family protein [Pseudorhodobacter sp.]|nr:histidine phosphatase family protein [Rhizobacter sp.]